MNSGAIVVPLRAVVIAAGVLLAVAVVVALALLPGPREAILRLTDPRTTAAPASVDQQRAATEHALQRGYVKATGQLTEVRKLTLAIPASQASAIADKALSDLKQIRHDALGAVGSRLGLAGSPLDAYVGTTEAQLGDNAFADDKPVLLAPDLYAVVARADDLFQRSADAATRELTKAPPTSAPTASPSLRPSPTATPSASPTGR